MTAHKDVVLRHPDKRVTWVMAPLGLAMVEELRERWPEARRWYQEAQSRCKDARVKPRQRIAQIIGEGLERLPPVGQ